MWDEYGSKTSSNDKVGKFKAYLAKVINVHYEDENWRDEHLCPYGNWSDGNKKWNLN